MSDRTPRGEFSAIAQWTAALPRAKGDPLGIGDDCAVLRWGEQTLLVTSDAAVEGIHFNLDWYAPQDAGYRAMAGAISDIAAMGGTPRYATVSVAVPGRATTDCIDAFYGGLRDAAARWDVAIVGGDTTRSPAGIFCDITVIGEAVEGRYVSRSGARPRDLLVVTGYPGRAAAALGGFLGAGREALLPQRVRDAHLRPVARVKAGQIFGQSKAVHAMIDVSDGLIQDARHLAERSGLGLQIDTTVHIGDQELAQACETHGLDLRACFWAGGEDYELAIAVAPEGLEALRSAISLPLNVVGQFSNPGDPVAILGPPLPREGFDHFHDSSLV